MNQGSRRALVVGLVMAGCKGAPVVRQEPIAAEPPASADDPGGAGHKAPAPEDGGAEAVEARHFWIRCGESERFEPPALPGGLGLSMEQSRACRVRGRVRAVRQVELRHRPNGVGQGGWSDPVVFRAIELRIAPDDAVPCRTPLDPDEKEGKRPEASHTDLERAGPILVIGGARIAGALHEGASLCGWAHVTRIPGLNGSGWETYLADGSGALLAASSTYFDRAQSKLLGNAFRFSREGPTERQTIDEGGWFVRHRSVRVHHGGASALSTGGAEVTLTGRDGRFAVAATSDLTAGPVPIFTGLHDGFVFSAVRVDQP